MKIGLICILFAFTALPIFAVIHKIADFANPGSGDYITLVGNTAYIADGESGLQILDVTNSQNLQFLGSYNTGDYAYSVCVVGHLAYVAEGESGLVILDVSNPRNPIMKGIYDSPYIVYSVKVVGQFAYLADGDTGLLIINVSNPQNPQLIGTCNTPDYALWVAVSGNRAYIADGESGLQIIDITNPQNPSILGSIDSMYYANDVTVVGNIAYVADGWFGLKIIDVSNPMSPILINTYDSNGDISSVTVSGNRAYLTGGFQIIDITDLYHIQRISYFDVPGWSRSIAVGNNTAYVTTEDSQLQILNIANTDSTLFLGSYPSPNSDYITSIEVNDSIAYVIGDYFKILNVSNPADIQTLGSIPLYNDFPLSVVIQGNIAYLCRDEGFKTIDISNLQNPHEFGYWSPFGTQLYITSLAVQGNTAYLTDEEWGLKIVDISNPQYPSTMGAYGPGTGYSVTVIDTLAYLAYGYNGLVIIGVSNPNDPVNICYFFTPTYAKEIRVSGHYAYLYGYESVLYIVDISNPRNPILVNSIELHPTSTINTIDIKDDLLFICDSDWNEIKIYDISNPASPLLRNNYAWNLGTTKIRVDNGKLYMLNGAHGLNILDLNLLIIGGNPPIVPQQEIHITNHPNPFKSDTRIDFSITNPGKVTIDIYNIKGQKVKQLLNDDFTADLHSVFWNSTNYNNHAVASGVYFARISSGGKSISRKLVLLK